MSQVNSFLTGPELARGVCSHLCDLGFACLEEFVLPGMDLRVDVMALGRKGEIWIIECKSSMRDFASDSKWPRYTEFCDRFFFAVGRDFPASVLPDGTGLMLSDGFDAELRSEGSLLSLAPARRKKLIVQFGRIAAGRLARTQG